MKKSIAVVVGDIGGAKELVAPVRILQHRGWNMQWFADPEGKAAPNLLVKEGIAYETHEPTPVHTDFRSVIVGTSATAAALGNAWTGFAKRRKIPAWWLADLWGTENRNPTDVDPDGIFVIDKTHAANARAKLPHVQVEIVGLSSFAADRHRLWEREQFIRSGKRGVGPQQLLVVFLSGGENPMRVDEQLKAVGEALSAGDVGDLQFHLEARLHPKLPEEMRQIAHERLNHQIKDLSSSSKLPTDRLVIAADLVVGDWGCTDIYRALAWGIPAAVFTNFPPDEARLTEAFPSGKPPHVACGAAREISDWRDVASLLPFMITHNAQECARVRAEAEPYRDLLFGDPAVAIADAIERIAA